MNEAINERLDAARAELLAALEAHLAFPPHGGNVRGRADSQARVDAASAEVERLRKALRLLGNAPEAAHAPAPAPAVARAAPVPKELGEKILSEEAFEAGLGDFQRSLSGSGVIAITPFRFVSWKSFRILSRRCRRISEAESVSFASRSILAAVRGRRIARS